MAEVRTIDAADARILRSRVLRPESPPDDLVYPQDHVDGALHLGVIERGAIVGVATLAPEPNEAVAPGRRAWRLRGMAVEPDLQGRGLGAAILEDGMGRIRDAGGDVVIAHARVSALGFYLRMGWEVIGEEFEENNRPHVLAVYDLTKARGPSPPPG